MRQILEMRWRQSLTAHYVGENEAGTESDTAWDNVTLVARKLMVLTRMSSELAEERMRLTRIVMVVLAALFCLQAGILLAVLFAVLAVGQEHVLLAIGIAALLLLLAAAGAGLWLRSWLKSRPPMFETTMAELRKDRDRLAGKS